MTSTPRKLTLPGVERVDAGQNLDQRRLAGAVLAEQRENLAGLEGHADVRQRFRAAEALEDAADLQQLARVRRSSAVNRSRRRRARQPPSIVPPAKRSALADWRAPR